MYNRHESQFCPTLPPFARCSNPATHRTSEIGKAVLNPSVTTRRGKSKNRRWNKATGNVDDSTPPPYPSIGQMYTTTTQGNPAHTSLHGDGNSGGRNVGMNNNSSMTDQGSHVNLIPVYPTPPLHITPSAGSLPAPPQWHWPPVSLPIPFPPSGSQLPTGMWWPSNWGIPWNNL